MNRKFGGILRISDDVDAIDCLRLARYPLRAHSTAMRTISDDVSVRLYYLDSEGGSAGTLLYGTLAEALAMAAAQPEDVQDGLFLQTSNDVIAYLDYLEG